MLGRRLLAAYVRRAAPYSTKSINSHPTQLSILIVECYNRDGRERLKSVGVRRASDTFASLLHKMTPDNHDMDIEFIQPADSSSHVAEVGELGRFDGVVWTGSALTIHSGTPEVERQIELARRIFEAGVPQYGSCWGAADLGGRRRASARGQPQGARARRRALDHPHARRPAPSHVRRHHVQVRWACGAHGPRGKRLGALARLPARRLRPDPRFQWLVARPGAQREGGAGASSGACSTIPSSRWAMWRG